MRLFGRNLEDEVAVVAEIGVNHEGQMDRALELLRLAASAGADAVKLQSFTPERYVSTSMPERLEQVRRFAFGEQEHERLYEEAERLGVPLFSTPVSHDWVDALRHRPAMKIASGDLTFELVIRAAAATGLPLIVSTGLGTVEEIDRAVAWVREEVGEQALSERLVLLHCVSAYPTPMDQANLRSIPFLRERYGVVTGYSNHVEGIDACLAAVALGAAVIEVHFTDQREGRSFRDHALSCDPPMFADLVRRVRGVRSSLGEHGKGRQPAEAANLEVVRKGLVAARDLAADTTLTAEDIAYARPATEFGAEEFDTVLGGRLRVPLKAGELLRRDDVEL